MDMRNDIDVSKIVDVSRDAEVFFKRELPGNVHKIKKWFLIVSYEVCIIGELMKYELVNWWNIYPIGVKCW